MKRNSFIFLFYIHYFVHKEEERRNIYIYIVFFMQGKGLILKIIIEFLVLPSIHAETSTHAHEISQDRNFRERASIIHLNFNVFLQ